MGNRQGQGVAIEPAMLFESAEEIEMKIRKVRPKRPLRRYSDRQKRKAMYALDYGTPARVIARMYLPQPCSLSTILRWRDKERQIEADRVRREDLKALNATLANAKKK